MTAGLALLAGAFLLRWWRTGHFMPRTGLGLPALLLGNVGLAVWISYDRPVSLFRFTRLLTTAVLMYAVIDSPPSLHGWLAAGFVLAAAALAL